MKRRKIEKGIIALIALFAGLLLVKRLTRRSKYDAENDKIRASRRAAAGESAGGEAGRSSRTYYDLYVKRGLDVGLSFLGMIVLAPVYLLIAAAIYIDDPGPVIFTQKRLGIGRTFFDVHKFRTMKLATPHDVPTHLLKDPEQYITKIGKLLRKYSLDELPQLWDIFNGDLSIVGPRPALWNQDDLADERDKYGANDIRPGLTGWAQINGRDELEIPVKAKLDGEYTAALNKSSLGGFLMDVRCFFGTIASVLRSEGVVEGQHTARTGEAPVAKKYLIITNHSYMLWQFRRELIARLMESGEVIISTPFVGHEKDFEAMGCRCIETNLDRRSIDPRKDLRLFRFYRELLKKERPDLVITYSIKPNVYAGFACRRLRIPYFVNVQGLGTAFQSKLMSLIVTVMYRAALRRARRVFFENEENAKDFLQRRIIPEDKILVLHGAGVNLDDYPCEPYPSEADGIHFLYLGRIMKEKGVDEFFAAARAIKARHGDRVKFDLVGFFEEEYKETVERLVNDGIAVFHGFQENPRPYYAAAHCVVLPSYHEGMSNVLLEAASTGRPLITSDIPGCREAVEEGVNGCLAAVKDASDLERAMEAFIALTPEERAAMGRRGREKMEREFDRKSVIEVLIEVLQISGLSDSRL